MTSTPRRATAPNILVLGTADWDQAIATNQHYMVRELLHSYPLTYSESFGLRKPELRRRDISRMAKRILARRKQRTSSEGVGRLRPDGLSVISPLVAPIHTGIFRAFNRYRVNRIFRHWANSMEPRILWTYTPLTYGLEKYAQVTVYHCVDLLGEFPGVSSSMVSAAEKHLAKNADVAIGSSRVVEQHLAGQGFKRVIHWPNVADVETILEHRLPDSARIRDRVVFAGNLSKAKIDFGLFHDVISAGFELHLAGPIAEGGGDATPEVEELVGRGAVYHGLLPLDELSRLYWTCSVGLIPYQITPYTRGVNPLKTFEYLAAGMGVVSTAVPAVQEIEGHVSVITAATECVDRIALLAGATQTSNVEARIVIAKKHSWQERGEIARALIAETLDGLETTFLTRK